MQVLQESLRWDYSTPEFQFEFKQDSATSASYEQI
jgi:hypothetical protein